MEIGKSASPSSSSPAEVPDITPLSGCSRGALVIRHGPRYGGDVALSTDDLTEAGKEAAFRLGRRLGNGKAMRFFSSPLNRCIQTATLIAEGAGVRADIETTRILGKPGPFPIDEAQVERYCIENTLKQFMVDWVDGKVPQTTIGPLPDGAKTLTDYVINNLRSGGDGLDVYIGHDIFLTPVPIHYLGYDIKDKGLLGFLDGFTLVMDEKGPSLAYRGKTVRI
jgi:hypothetical protein